jgi:hypothetical protein
MGGGASVYRSGDADFESQPGHWLFDWISLVSLKVPIHVRVWLASPHRGAWLGSQARRYIYIYIIGQNPARDTPHTDEFGSLEPEPSRTR